MRTSRFSVIDTPAAVLFFLMMNNIQKEDIALFAQRFALKDELKASTFLITGATGLIGSTLIHGLLAADDITFVQAREVLDALDGADDDPEEVVEALGMRQSADSLSLVVDEVLGRCEDQVRQYRSGNRKVVGYLVGQCMKASAGAGNPKLFNQLLLERLEG